MGECDTCTKLVCSTCDQRHAGLCACCAARRVTNDTKVNVPSMNRGELEREIKAAMRVDLLAAASGMREGPQAQAAQRRLEQLRGWFTDAEVELLGEQVAAETADHPTIKAAGL